MPKARPPAASLPAPWEAALSSFLLAKERRSGSRRTVEAYESWICACFGGVGKAPDMATRQEIFGWAHGVGASGRAPSPATVAARLAAVSSFYRFLIRLGLTAANPCDALERPHAPAPTPRGLTPAEVKRLLAVVPNTPAGLRDRAVMLTLLLTGRRRTEVLGLTAGDLEHRNGRVSYRYRGKGGKRGQRELPLPAMQAIEHALAASGTSLDDLAPDASLWPSRSGRGLSAGTFYSQLQTYLAMAGLPRSGVHVFRHTAAKLRRDAGDSVEEVSRFLDHASLGVTTLYLRRLEGEEDRSWDRVAAVLDLEYER